MPPGQRLPRYRLADLLVDVGRRTVTRGTSDIRLSKLSFELLRTLIGAAPNIVSNEELAHAVWHGVIVGPETVTQRVKLLRDALGDNPEAPRYIAGLRGQGYRILPPVQGESSDLGPTTSEGPATSKGRTRSRLLPILVGATVLSLALVYVFVDQLVTARHGEASQAVMSSGIVGDLQPPPRSVAVLPFSNISGDKEQEYFSDGLSEDLITALSKLQGLKVVGRTSSFRFRDHREDSRTIGAKLGVAHLLEGSVRRAGNVIRVSAELINTADGSTQWSEHYDRPYKDLFALQDDITRAVADVLKARLLADGQAATQSDRPPSGNLDAYAEFLQGKFHFMRDTEFDTRKAVEHFERATQLDPRYALAWSWLSRAWANLSELFLTGASSSEGYAKARMAADRALALAPDLAAAHFARGNILEVPDLNWRAAEAEFRRALQLAPEDGDAKYFLGSQLATLGQIDQAIELTHQAISTDPLHASRYGWLSLYLLGVNRLDEAERAVRKAIELQPTAISYHQVLTRIAVARGDLQTALEAAEQEPAGVFRDFALALARQLGSDQAAANAALNTLIHRGNDAAFFVAEVYSIRGDKDRMLEWLDRAWNYRDSGVALVLYDPFLLRYKDDFRFASFCRKVGLPAPAEAKERT
jgi:TolB-like protein/DNA-binding winged helix-turn-helix (wHTH) protein/Tfp pilus assembly protein PilF